MRCPATPWKAFSSVSSHFLYPGPSAFEILTTSCLSRAHTWRLLPPSLRLSLLHHIPHFLFPCCALGMPPHTGLLLASVSACWFCGHRFFPALLSLQSWCWKAGSLTLIHCVTVATCTQTQPWQHRCPPQMTAQPLPRCEACSQQLPIPCSSRAVFQALEPWL